MANRRTKNHLAPLRHAGDGGGDDVDDGIVLYYTIVKYSYKKGPR